MFQTTCLLRNRRGGVFFHFKPKFARQPHGSQDADRVFLITFCRIADHHQLAVGNIADAVMEIDDFFFNRVVIKRVAGKITAHGIFFHAAVSVVFHNPAVRVLLHLAAAPEGRHLYGFRPDHDVNDLKTSADDAASAENLMNLFRRRIGGDVEVFRFDTQQQIANRPADNISLKTFVMQTADNLFRRKTQHIRADVMLVERKDFLRHRRLLRLLSGQNFMQPFFQHKLLFPK